MRLLRPVVYVAGSAERLYIYIISIVESVYIAARSTLRHPPLTPIKQAPYHLRLAQKISPTAVVHTCMRRYSKANTAIVDGTRVHGK